MRYFNGLATRQVENKVVNAQDIQPGDFVNGEGVDCIQVDLGMVVVYYRTGNYCFFLINLKRYQFSEDKMSDFILVNEEFV